MGPDRIIDEIIRREGDQYTNRPADRGGPTKYGITQQTLSRWRKRPVSAREVAALREDEARAIYHYLYIVEPGFDGIEDQRLRELMVDSGVQHGTRRVTRWLQRAAGAGVDGILGPRTRRAIRETGEAVVYRRVLARRVRFYGRIVTRFPDQAEFAAGWANRAAEFIEAAP